MCLIHESHHDGSLLHSFLCIFHLKYPTLWRAGILLASDGSEEVELVLQGDGVVVVIVSEHRGEDGIGDESRV
jgi:hypothetical protein